MPDLSEGEALLRFNEIKARIPSITETMARLRDHINKRGLSLRDDSEKIVRDLLRLCRATTPSMAEDIKRQRSAELAEKWRAARDSYEQACLALNEMIEFHLMMAQYAKDGNAIAVVLNDLHRMISTAPTYPEEPHIISRQVKFSFLRQPIDAFGLCFYAIILSDGTRFLNFQQPDIFDQNAESMVLTREISRDSEVRLHVAGQTVQAVQLLRLHMNNPFRDNPVEQPVKNG